MMMQLRTWLAAGGVGIALLSFFGCVRSEGQLVVTEQPASRMMPTRITLAAVGDVLIHQRLLTAAYDPSSGDYHFAPLFAPVAPYLQSADYALANFETRMAGEQRGYSGYPLFNSPASLAPALKATGYKLLATANNHCLDMGWPGVVHTLDNIDAAGLSHIGTARSPEEAQAPFIVDIKGVHVAFLNYTEMTNGFSVPNGKEYAVNYLHPKRVIADAAAARRQGAELVIAILHFGEEYHRRPSAYQRATASTLLAGGVDVIIAAHPHVVQPIEKLTVQRNGHAFTGVVAYSLGNFISSQRDRYRDCGIILFLTIEKDARGSVAVVGVHYLPVWVQLTARDGRLFSRVLPADPSFPIASDISLSVEEQLLRKQAWLDTNTLLENQSAGILPYAAK